MPKYCNNFQLDPADLDLIEDALRKVISHSSVVTPGENSYVQALNALLGKLHNQKVFYSQVNKTGIPAG